MRNWLVVSLLMVLWLGSAGCGADMLDDGTDPSQPGDDPLDPASPKFISCTSGAIPTGLPTVDWSNTLNEIITLADPWHSAQDVVAQAGKEITIAGKFSYGAISKDLEGERIQVWIDDCKGGYRKLGERVTNSDGRIALPLTAAEVPATGEYGLYLRVMGDDSDARARLRVYPASTQFIVFDVDATLTTSDTELVGQVISEILDGSSVPEPREGAQAITDLRQRKQGYELIYLTGRPYLLDGITRRWLIDLGFPSGTVHLTDEVSNSWPSDSQVGTYKAAFLRQLLDNGFILHAAYGNATSDIFAYEQAGIAKQQTFIMGTHGGESSTVGLGEAYTDHVALLAGEPPAKQPFTR